MLAPAISGQLFYFIGYIWTGVFIAAWNVLSVVCEYALLQGIYNQYPRLAQKITNPRNINEIEEHGSCEEDNPLTNDERSQNKKQMLALEKDANVRSCGRTILHAFQESVQGWKTYFDHPVRHEILKQILN